jgi:hypothetical protein
MSRKSECAFYIECTCSLSLRLFAVVYVQDFGVSPLRGDFVALTVNGSSPRGTHLATLAVIVSLTTLSTNTTDTEVLRGHLSRQHLMV